MNRDYTSLFMNYKPPAPEEILEEINRAHDSHGFNKSYRVLRLLVFQYFRHEALMAEHADNELIELYTTPVMGPSEDHEISRTERQPSGQQNDTGGPVRIRCDVGQEPESHPENGNHSQPSPEFSSKTSEMHLHRTSDRFSRRSD